MILAERLAHAIDGVRPDGRLLVAVDGPDAAGKTTLVRQLAEVVKRPVVTASVDSWHNPQEIRTRRGVESAEGYYLDAFDHAALRTRLLEPFRAGDDVVCTAAFDYPTDRPLALDTVHVPTNAVLLFDGVFLHRSELRECWDLTVYLHIPEAVTLERALRRDLDLFASEEQLLGRYQRRYLPAQALYREQADPMAAADIVVDNTDVDAPRVLRWPIARDCPESR